MLVARVSRALAMEFATNRPAGRGLMTPTGTFTRGSSFLPMLAYIALAGLLGTVARYALQGWIQTRGGVTTFPIGTLVINVVGSLILGLVMRYATGSTGVTPEVRGALTIGFCGAFTTMSTFSYETTTLIHDAQYWHAAVYMGATVLGSLVAVIAGSAIASRLL